METLGGAVGGLASDVVGAFEAEDYAWRIFGVRGEIVLEEVEGVGGWGAVEGALDGVGVSVCGRVIWKLNGKGCRGCAWGD